MNTLRVILLSSIAAFTVACTSTPSKPATPAAPPAANIAGNWLLAVESPMGKQDALMSVEQSGKEFKGRLESSLATVDFTGTVNGSEVKLAYDYNIQGMNYHFAYVGKLEADAISGHILFGVADSRSPPGEATFTAKRP